MNSKEEVKGIYYAVLAFVIWGLVPVYFKAVDHIEPLEVVSHRVIWSALFLALVLMLSRRLLVTFRMLKSSRLMLGLLFSALVVSINWLVFIWAVGQEKIVETTLGYFINPLINIVFGFFIFSERLRFLQWCAVALAAAGVAYQLITFGELPWIALVLALSFSTYGVLRKKIKVDAVAGLFIETLWLSPLAIIYLLVLNHYGQLQFFQEGTDSMFLLLAAGLVTSFPLLAFAAGAKRISLTLLGFIQYLGPSLALLIAVYYYNEPMDMQRLVTFVFIWAALVLFTVEGVVYQKGKLSAQDELN
ncbi:MAG: EamA family transporter RarD [Neptuniibacter sp.]